LKFNSNFVTVLNTYMADIEAGVTTVAAQKQDKKKHGCCERPFPEDKEAARAWGEKMIKGGYAMMGAGVSCAGGMIGGIGGGTGNWGGAVGGASGMFFGLVFGGTSLVKDGKQAIAYANGDIAYPFDLEAQT
jgi:hypothetical protein